MIVWSDKGSSASFIFPSLVQRYILSIVYVHSLKVFVAAAADLSFKIFDLQLHLIESIRHEERTITALEYDDSKGALLIASAEGVSFWRIYRNIDYNCHVLERLFRFAEANSWVSRFICAFQDDKVYAVIDTSVQVLSIDQRKMVTLLRDIHFAQITAVSWYSRSKCYITGCMSGLIKVWTTRIVVNKSRNIANKTTSGQQQEVEKLCLLHTFDGTHTKAISGLVMHTIPGLCITASMDALIKLINLETFTELMTVRTDYPITSFRGSTYLGRPALVFTQENGTVRIWEVLSFLQFFGTSASRIRGLQYTENLQLFADTRYDVETKGVELETSVVKRDTLRATRLMRRRQSVAKEHLYTYGSLAEGAMVVSADQDLRMLNLQGSFMCCLEPQFVVDGLLAHQCSIYQQILFCAYYTQSGQILKAFDATLPDYGLISEISPSIPEGDRITCLGLMNALPLNCIMGGSKNINVVRSDLRGSPIPYYIEEVQ
jgi:WD40 repeat protein